MSYIDEKIAYVQGLANGLGVEQEGAGGKVLAEMLDVMHEMADVISQLENDYLELEEYVEAIDDDLAFVEERHSDLEVEDGEEEYLALECPTCGTVLELDPEEWDETEPPELICPGCGEPLVEDEELHGDYGDGPLETNHSDGYSDQ